MQFSGIDLSSDTASLPTEGMKRAMMCAVVGDEQKHEDPTTLELESILASLLKKDKSIFLPSATMANIIAIKLLCEPGTELVTAQNSHVALCESGGAAIHSGVMIKPIHSRTGLFTGEDILSVVSHRVGARFPKARSVLVENTTNLGGGIAWTMEQINSVVNTADKLSLRKHLDGSRLFNASMRIGVNPATITKGFDTVTVCLSKGLGCPLGALLVCNEHMYERAVALKHLFGGAMRQTGLLSAAGIYALTNHINRLMEDHQLAEYFLSRLSEIEEIQVRKDELMTNMVFFKWQGNNFDYLDFHNFCLNVGVRFSVVDENCFRAVFYVGITKECIDMAINKIKGVIKNKKAI